MATKVASLFAEIGADTSGLKRGLSEAKTDLGGVKKAFGAIVASGIILQAGKAIFDFYSGAAKEAEVAAVAQAQLEAVLISTGHAAGLNADAINGMADEMSKATGIEDDLLIKNEALMLTFTKVGKEIFPDAMKAAADMSAVLGQDLQSSVIQLGKALNDPIQGVTALKRVGVNFNEAQRETIKLMVESGDVMGAQQFILQELQTEFGGAAEAMYDAGTKSEGLKNSFGNLKEAIGAGLLPKVKNFNEEMISTIDSMTEQVEITVALRKALSDGTITQAEYNAQVTNLHGAVIIAAGAQDWLNGRMAIAETAFQRGRSAVGEYVPVVKDAGTQTSITAGMTRDFADDMYEGENAARAMGAALATDTKKTKELRGALGELMGLDTSFFSTIASTLDKIDWKKAGGGDIEKAVDSASNAFDTGKITVDEYRGILDKAALAALTVEGNLDGLNNIEIAEHLTDQLGTPPKLALALVEEMQDVLTRMTARDYIINLSIRQSGGALGGSALHGVGTKRASGSPNWETVPAGYPNDSFNVGMTSGEKFFVAKQGETAPAGGGITIQGGITINGASGNVRKMVDDFLAELGRRQRRANATGAAFLGG
jgi:hypothetical protein